MMSKETLKVLEMVAEGKISPEEGERLIKALGGANRSARRRGPGIPPVPDISIPKIDLGNLGEICVELKNRVSETSERAHGQFKRSRAAKFLKFKDYPVTIETPEDVKSCQLGLDIRAGRMKFRGGDTNSYLISGKARRVPDPPVITTNFEGDQPEIKIKNSLGRMSLRASEAMTYMLSLTNSASESRLDLEQLIVEELSIDNNAGNVLIDLGEKAKRVEVEINNNAGNMRIRVPKTHSVRITPTGNLSSDNLEKYGLVVVDGVATASDWDENPLGVDIVLTQNVASFKLDWRRRDGVSVGDEEPDTDTDADDE